MVSSIVSGVLLRTIVDSASRMCYVLLFDRMSIVRGCLLSPSLYRVVMVVARQLVLYRSAHLMSSNYWNLMVGCVIVRHDSVLNRVDRATLISY